MLETMTIVAEEFGFEMDFVNTDIEESIAEVADAQKNSYSFNYFNSGSRRSLKLIPTDYIREENVIAGESGGITPFIGAYGRGEGGQKDCLITPGHRKRLPYACTWCSGY
jgi:translation initiation factor IF-2